LIFMFLSKNGRVDFPVPLGLPRLKPPYCFVPNDKQRPCHNYFVLLIYALMLGSGLSTRSSLEKCKVFRRQKYVNPGAAIPCVVSPYLEYRLGGFGFHAMHSV
jgi:hypothetical protein